MDGENFHFKCKTSITRQKWKNIWVFMCLHVGMNYGWLKAHFEGVGEGGTKDSSKGFKVAL